MEKFPQRSWAKTNTQLWTLAMRDPLPTRQQNNNNFSGGSGKKGDACEVCWRYNRNQCKKSACDCKFKHRCSYCGAHGHNYIACFKRKKQESDHAGGQDSVVKATSSAGQQSGSNISPIYVHIYVLTGVLQTAESLRTHIGNTPNQGKRCILISKKEDHAIGFIHLKDTQKGFKATEN